MNVLVLYRNDPERPLKDPVLEPTGRCFVLRLLIGDVADPFIDPDGWFGPKPPRFVLRFWSPFPLPFIAFRWPDWLAGFFPKLKGRACYLGSKVYGADDPNYTWLAPEDRAAGSTAMHFSIRPFGGME